MLRQLRQILEKEQIQFVLAGGLTPDNVSRGIDIFSPDIVDVSSGVEKEPGQGTGKDREKYRNLCGTCILLFRRQKIRNITVFRYRK